MKTLNNINNNNTNKTEERDVDGPGLNVAATTSKSVKGVGAINIDDI